MDNQNLELTQREREVLMELFEENLLRDNYRDYHGKHQTRIYRSRHLDIKDVRFAKKVKQDPILQSLVEKKVIVKEKIWYRLYIKESYMNAIYNLADQGNWDLVTQLANTWIEVQE